MSKQLAISFAIIALLACTLTTTAVMLSADEPRELKQRVYMRVKLQSSGKVLEGIVTRDFTLIDQAAQEMHEMSRASEWPRAKDDLYEHYSVEFQRLCGKLSSLAKEENLEGVSFTYMQLTSSCITCHDHVFSSLKRAPDPSGPFQLIPNARLPRKR
ncbi:MAG: hypothetical protein HKN47_05655 [Pirellulaceae bacterium]|nr:hypothetical protein [Pirellulaceae bacterium]